MKTIVLVLLSFLLPFPAEAKEFEIFDGHFYNNLFYPLVDNIEWGEQYGELPHMEFHFHSKDKPMDVAVVAGDKNGTPVLWIMYDLKFRGEKVCRYVPAPKHFKEGMKLYTYRDNSDPDYDNVYISSEPYNNKKFVAYTMPAYSPCLDENAENMPSKTGTAVANSAPAAGAKNRGPASAAAPEATKKSSSQDDGAVVPFNF